MLVAIVLLQVARRLSLPYPAMLASAGVAIALIPGTPILSIDPETYLALFIAPVLVDAAYDFPLGVTRRILAPLIAFAIFGVLLTTCVVAFMAHALAGLPLAAGFVLGAIVAPPDAAAATAVLRGASIPRNTYAVLQGESLFNDSTALLLFGASLAVLESHGLHASVGLRLVAAVPGGVLFGIGGGYLATQTNRFVRGTLGGNLLQFILAYAVWIIASHLGLSSVLATVALAMTIARRTDATALDARMRVQSFAVWSAVVFALNVFAFMLMGMQARLILSRMDSSRLRISLLFASDIVAAVVLVRMLLVVSFNRLDSKWERAHGRPQPATIQQAVFVGWCGMRGFVTMATALSLPENFPQRDMVVLTAFMVVLATLVVQGLTLRPVIRLLGLDRREETRSELDRAKTALAVAGLSALRGESGPEAESLRYRFTLVEQTCSGQSGPGPWHRMRQLGLRAVKAEREELERLRERNEISIGAYLAMQEQVDWTELTLLDDEDRTIEEI